MNRCRQGTRAALTKAIDLVQMVKQSTFRAFLHDPAAIDAVLRHSGLERRTMHRTLGSEVVVYQREIAIADA